MNCLLDHAASPAWNGTTFVAIRGRPEDFIQRYASGALRNATTFRTVRRTANYNSEYSYKEASWWGSESNLWWRKAGVYLLESDWRETLAEGQQRLDNLMADRSKFIIAVAVIGVVLSLLPLLEPRQDKYWSLIAVLVIVCVVVNPLTVGGIGIACVLRTDDPRTRDESWLMCQAPGGSFILGVAAVLFPCVGFVCWIIKKMDGRRPSTPKP